MLDGVALCFREFLVGSVDFVDAKIEKDHTCDVERL